MREWSATSLPTEFLGGQQNEILTCFSTLSQAVIRGIFSGACYLSEHCPSFPLVLQMPTNMRSCLISVCRNEAYCFEWVPLFGTEEGAELRLAQHGHTRQTANVLQRQ